MINCVAEQMDRFYVNVTVKKKENLSEITSNDMNPELDFIFRQINGK